MKKTEHLPTNMDELAELCRQIKAPAMFNAIKQQEADPDLAQLPFLSRICQAMRAEIEARRQKRCARLFKESGLKDPMPSIAGIIYESSRGLKKEVVASLAECRWITEEPRLNVLITGMAGTGKTWLAKALGNEAIKRGLSVSYWRAADLIDRISQARRDGEPVQFRSRLNSKQLLIIDDFAMTPMDEQTRDDSFSLIDERMGCGSLVIASQRSVSDWYQYIGDKYHADAILDRLTNSSYRFELKGRSFREKSKAARKTEK